MINKIEIDPIFDTRVGKWVVAEHERVIIEKDLNMTQEITCEYYEDDEGSIGIKTSDFIASLDVPDTEKQRLNGMYKSFSFSRSTRNRYVAIPSMEPIEITDPMTGEMLELEEGVDYISERTMYQGIPNIPGKTKVSEHFYFLIEQNIIKMRDRNLAIS